MRQEDGSSAELRNAARVIAEALSCLGCNVDPASDDDLDHVVQYISGLMATDQANYDQLVVALLEASGLASRDAADSGELGYAKQFVPVRIYAERTHADDFLMDDAPSRGRLLSALDTVWRAKGIAKR